MEISLLWDTNPHTRYFVSWMTYSISLENILNFFFTLEINAWILGGLYLGVGDDYSVHGLSMSSSHFIFTLSLTWHFQVSNFSGVLQGTLASSQTVSSSCHFLFPSLSVRILSTFCLSETYWTLFCWFISSIIPFIICFCCCCLLGSWERRELKLCGQPPWSMSIYWSPFKIY